MSELRQLLAMILKQNMIKVRGVVSEVAIPFRYLRFSEIQAELRNSPIWANLPNCPKLIILPNLVKIINPLISIRIKFQNFISSWNNQT